MRHRRVIRRTRGKEPIKKSSTFVSNIGQGTSAPGIFSILTTSVGDRSAPGATQVIKSSATTSNTANVGDIVKYVNLCIECGNRNPSTTDTFDHSGWLEYAFVIQQEAFQAMVSTNLGIQTLGDTASKQFRGNCIFTGCVPVGAQQPVSIDMKMKIPPKYVKIQTGTNYTLFTHFRSTNSTNVETDTLRLVQSCIYKVYS